MPGSPSVSQAFTLDMYFNSQTTDPLQFPAPKNGTSVPSGWGTTTDPAGQGYVAWRREWRVWDPGSQPPNPWWSPGLRQLNVHASSNANSHYYAAQGQVLTINLWDLRGQGSTPPNPTTSTATQISVQVAAYYTANGQKTFFTPPFSGYCWGLWCGSPSTFPSLQTGQNFVPLSSPSSSQVNNAYQTGPNTSQQMNVGALISMQFNDSITPPSGVTQIGLQFAVYLMLTPQNGNGVWCFDDPEMEVDCP